jgi:ribokinase
MVNATRHAAPRLGVVGTCNVDQVVRCHRLARPGETVLGDDVVRFAGGKGANQAVAAAHLDAHVTLIATLGDDDSGRWLYENLRGHGVNVDLMQWSARPTGTAFITLDDSGENEIVVSLGANRDLDLGGVDLGAFDVVLAQMEVATAVIDDVVARSRCCIVNVVPSAGVNHETLSRCAVVIANEIEAESLDVAALEHVVVTLGSGGAVHYQRGREVARAAALDVEPVDTVGAGEVFCAAYAVEFARGASAHDALSFAAAAGSLATLALGAQGALPTFDEVQSRLTRAS